MKIGGWQLAHPVYAWGQLPKLTNCSPELAKFGGK
jgi:hypothetical protein